MALLPGFGCQWHELSLLGIGEHKDCPWEVGSEKYFIQLIVHNSDMLIKNTLSTVQFSSFSLSIHNCFSSDIKWRIFVLSLQYTFMDLLSINLANTSEIGQQGLTLQNTVTTSSRISLPALQRSILEDLYYTNILLVSLRVSQFCYGGI